MAEFRRDGVLYDPLKTISRNVDKAINLNKDIARTNTQTVIDIEKEKQRSLREITRMQKSLAATTLHKNNNRKLQRFASFDESVSRQKAAMSDEKNRQRTSSEVNGDEKTRQIGRQRTSSDIFGTGTAKRKISTSKYLELNRKASINEINK